MLWETEISLDRPQSAFEALQSAWKLHEKKVFVLRGGRVDDPRQFYTDKFPLIGTPVPLAEDATIGDREHQRTGEIWMEVRYDPQHPDAYRHSANAQPLHTDGSYIPSFPNATLMTCVANSGEGGETTFIDGADVVAALQSEAPALLEKLQSEPLPHARSGDSRIEKVIDMDGDAPLMNWNYYCVDKDLDAEKLALADEYFEFLQNSPTIQERTVAVKLMPGDAVTWKDRAVLHGRNGFVATRESERFLWKCAIDVGQFDA
jgi:alpha-ketoglutarate-dependent taurine dioxygenase